MASSHATCRFTIKKPQTTTESETWYPTDRSIPAVISTNVKPTAMMPSVATCLAMLKRLLTVRKWGVRTLNATTSNTSTSTMPISLA